MQDVFLKAEEHRGVSFIEILQNCLIFNDKVHDRYTNRKVRPDWSFFLEHGQPILFGKETEKALVQKGATLEVVEGVIEKDKVVVHNEKDPNLASLLANLSPHKEPMPMGVLHRVDDLVYEGEMNVSNSGSL